MLSSRVPTIAPTLVHFTPLHFRHLLQHDDDVCPTVCLSPLLSLLVVKTARIMSEQNTIYFRQTDPHLTLILTKNPIFLNVQNIVKLHMLNDDFVLKSPWDLL